jgi:hypothetical protein
MRVMMTVSGYGDKRGWWAIPQIRDKYVVPFLDSRNKSSSAPFCPATFFRLIYRTRHSR